MITLSLSLWLFVCLFMLYFVCHHFVLHSQLVLGQEVEMVCVGSRLLPSHLQNFSGSNTDGSFTTPVSNSFLSPLENNHPSKFVIRYGDFISYTRRGNSIGNIQYTVILKKIEKMSLLCRLY